MYKRFSFFVFLLLSQTTSFAQWLQRNDNIPMKIDDYYIANAWAGGFNAPQFSNIDLNQDGIVTEEEIKIYEKSTGEKYKPSI